MGGGVSGRLAACDFSLVCDMKGRDPQHASRCFEQCISMNSRQGTHVTVSTFIRLHMSYLNGNKYPLLLIGMPTGIMVNVRTPTLMQYFASISVSPLEDWICF